MTSFLKHISTQQAPQPDGPYSQAIQTNDLVFISGQTSDAYEPQTPHTSSIEHQATHIMDNLKAISEAAGGSLENIIKLNIYLTDIAHLTTTNQIIENHFTEPYPCRTVLVVKALESQADINIDGIMALNHPFSLEELAVIT